MKKIMTVREAIDERLQLEAMFEQRWYDTFTQREQIIVDRITALLKYESGKTDTIDMDWVLPPEEKQ